MKTRIISGVGIFLVLAAVLFLWSKWSIVAVIFTMILALMASYEALYKTGYNKNKPMVILASVYSFFAVLFFGGYVKIGGEAVSATSVTVIFAALMIILSLKNHTQVDAARSVYSMFMPIALAFSYSSFASLLNFPDGRGMLYFLLLLNFSSISDCGAYFVGCAIGKHKLAPVLSPKKTWEGVFGGIASSMVFTVIIVLVYNAITGTTVNLIPFLVATPVFAALGMVGDIFFSFIKRCCGIKDYSNLIPGHGGILDRTDSILMIAPVLYLFLDVYSKIV